MFDREFNMNKNVEVTLTDAGLKTLEEFYRDGHTDEMLKLSGISLKPS